MAQLAQSIFITGASRGIGLEFVKQIAKTKPKVLIAACRDPASATALQAIATENAFVKIVKLDIGNDHEIDAAVKETETLVGDAGLNILINNAGIYYKEDGGELLTQTRERLQEHFNVNATSPILVTQKFLPLLKMAATSTKATSPFSCAKAASVNISSIMGSQEFTHKHGKGVALHYKCSKSALTMAGVLMAREFKELGILVVNFHPGWVKTDMGGANADVTDQVSVGGMLDTLRKAGEEESGLLIDYKGEVLPF